MSTTHDASRRTTLLTDRHLYLGALKEEGKAASWGSPTRRGLIYTRRHRARKKFPSLPRYSGTRVSDETAFNLSCDVPDRPRTGSGSAGHLAAAWLGQRYDAAMMDALKREEAAQ